MSQIAVVIPALDPDERLISYCDSLVNEHGVPVVVIDDGSAHEKQVIFDKIAAMDNAVVLHHPVNLGKGCALKNAFSYIIGKEISADIVVTGSADYSGIAGVVTADSDGQHSVKDVIRIGEELAKGKKELVLGARDFDSDNVPPKSKSGNKITRFLFKLLYRVKLVDTQTGLRGLPLSLLPEYIECRGNRFEYELDMLIVSSRKNIPIVEIPIETIYENQNEGTHFRVIMDSAAIYRVLLGSFLMYTLSSISSFVVDIVIFQILLLVMMGFSSAEKIFVATCGARVVSSIYNYLVNRKLVFGKTDKGLLTTIGYYTLVLVQMFCSAKLVILVCSYMMIPEALAKVIVDMLLFLASYQIQKRIIFR